MKLSQFKFNYTEGLAAKHPTDIRHDSKMMVLNRATGKIEHKKFNDILSYFDDRDVFITNNTKVFPARLYGSKEKTGAKIEVFLLRELNKEMKLWDVLVDPARKIRVGNKLYFGDDTLVAEVVDNTTSRGRTIRFLFDGTDEELWKLIDKLGEMPIPKYMGRSVEKNDRERFQTIFAKNIGEAVEIANRIAPEHLQILTNNPVSIAKKIKNAGAIFLGPYSPTAVGDYVAGPSHVLPTLGTARSG